MKSDIFNFFPKVEISYKEKFWQDGQKGASIKKSEKSQRNRKLRQDVLTVYQNGTGTLLQTE